MWRRLGRASAARFRQNWPTGVAVGVFLMASELFDDGNGDKGLWAWIASGVVAVAVLLVLRWVRDSSPHPEDDPSPHP